MRRVLLMVQNGSERPKCWRVPVRFTPAAVGAGILTGFFSERTPIGANCKRAAAADRWWLVEAESADDARGIIALAEHVNDIMAPNCGRVLASGGRAAEKGDGK